jgi:transcriptional regulator with GAF, ATPase, and Fis domain
MRREPWLHFWGPKDLAGAKALLECLKRAGICVRTLDGDGRCGEGILCFSRIDEELCDFVQELSRNKDGYVLAIPTANIAIDTSLWQLLQAGASDILVWSSGADLGERIKARLERWRAVDDLVNSPAVQAKLVGASPAWRRVLRQIVEMALFTFASVLLIGESGTGKELIAQLIHELDPRASTNELVILDCTTIVPELSGSEFFGHERGAFTGAVGTRDGAFAVAHRGTLFLDEVGELPMSLQAQLLRVIQEGTYKRVGGNAWHRTEFRLVCATNKDLEQARARGEFRTDLYYRIAGWVFRVPSLAERREDILPLTEHFLRLFRPNHPCLELDRPVREYLLSRAYPGNIRDLRQLIGRISSRHVGPGPITVGDIPPEELPADGLAHRNWRNADFDRAVRHSLALGAGLKEIGQVATDAALRIVLDEENGNLQLAARRLGVTDRALQMRRAAWRSREGGSRDELRDDGGL